MSDTITAELEQLKATLSDLSNANPFKKMELAERAILQALTIIEKLNAAHESMIADLAKLEKTILDGVSENV